MTNVVDDPEVSVKAVPLKKKLRSAAEVGISIYQRASTLWGR